jgi:hypothetical protein
VYIFCSVVLHRNVTKVYAGIMGAGGGLLPRWLEHTVQRALVHDFRGPGFLANSWYGSSPNPLSLQLVCPPLLGTKGGGGNTRMRVKGGSQFGQLERKPGTLFTLPVPNGRKLNRKIRQTCNRPRGKLKCTL